LISWHRTLATLLLTLCWGSVGLAWVVGALLSASVPSSSQRRASRMPVWLLSMVGIWLLDRRVPKTVWTILTWSPAWLHVVGICCLLPSTAWTLWARGVLGRMWSDSVAVRGEQVLHTDGPYRVTRHPIYIGILGMLLGSLLLNGFGVWLLLCSGGAVVIVAKIPAEERRLREILGKRYRDYQRRVPALVPGFHLHCGD
jgi:protein-S-isoprenylcysteine O-methyltransferase Ste14